MHLPIIFFLILLVGGFSTPVHGFFPGKSVQDYMDTFIDEEKFRHHGITSLNETTRDHIWSYFKSFHGRSYSCPEEEQKRRLIVHNHINTIVKHRLNQFRTFEIGLNHLADLTPEEFKKFKKGYIPPTSSKRQIEEAGPLQRRKLPKKHRKQNIVTKRQGSSALPSSFDWRSKNVVGSIKDQLQCGSCYAFATSAVMESLYAIKNNLKSVVDLSPQEIVDCMGNGCDGGNFPPAVDYIVQQGDKQATFASYPYVGVQQTCRTSGLSYSQLGKIQYTYIPEGNEKSLAAAIVSYGPCFIGFDASSDYFQLYTSGIYGTTSECSNQPEDIDHAVVVVGYGYNATLKKSYWIAKNSWGTSWGQSGYFLLAKDAGNMCGVATDAYYAQLK